MLASIHIADIGPRRALGLVAKGTKRIATPGLRSADLAIGARLGGSLFTKLEPGRAALLAMWDDDDALDRFNAESPVAKAFEHGWQVRLAPLRSWGAWPGLPEDISHARKVQGSGPVGVFTLARVKPQRLVPFLRTSAKAEAQSVGAPGLLFGTALVRPPFAATCTLWESAEASTAYAFSAGHAHNAAIAAGREKPFHHQEAFIRFRPYASAGHLDGRNQLPETLLASA